MVTAPAQLLDGREQLLEAVEQQYALAEQFYDGDCGDVYASAKVRRLLVKAGADEIEEFNYAAIPVDVVANQLKIVAITGTLPDREQDGVPADEQEQDPIQEAIDELIRINELRREWHGLHHGASRYGDYYMHVWPVVDDRGTVTTVEIRVKGPDRVRVVYSEQDPLEKAYAIELWEVQGSSRDKSSTRYRANLWFADHLERWITIPKQEGTEPDHWEHYVSDDDDRLDGWRIDYPAGLDEVPFFHFRNARPYGRPEHLRAYGPQRMINKLVSSHAVLIDFQTFPQRYMLMDPAATDRMSNFIDPDNPEDDDDPESPDGISVLRSDPAAVWRLWAKSVGQFDPADPQQILGPLDRYVRSISELTGIPLFRFGPGFGSTPSGQALMVARAPEIERVLDRQEAYEAEHIAVFQLALRLMGLGEVDVQVTWRPVRQVDDAEGWGVIGTKIDRGVPVRQAFIEAGYLPEAVDDWLDEPDGPAMVRRMQLMNAIGTFIQAAGTGVATGVVSSEMVRQVVDMVLGANQQITQEQLENDGTMPQLPPKPEPPAPAAAPAGAAGQPSSNGGSPRGA